MARTKRGKHTSVRRIFQRSIEWLEGLNGVRKVILCPHRVCHHSMAPGTLVVVQDETTGIRLRGYTDGGIMDIFLILELPGYRERITQAIRCKFPIGRTPQPGGNVSDGKNKAGRLAPLQRQGV